MRDIDVLLKDILCLMKNSGYNDVNRRGKKSAQGGFKMIITGDVRYSQGNPGENREEKRGFYPQRTSDRKEDSPEQNTSPQYDWQMEAEQRKSDGDQ